MFLCHVILEKPRLEPRLPLPLTKPRQGTEREATGPRARAQGEPQEEEKEGEELREEEEEPQEGEEEEPQEGEELR